MSHAKRVRAIAGLLAGVLLASVVSGCGDDDGESAQERYCAAGEDLEASVTSLVELDLIAEGTNGLEAAIESVIDDVAVLDETASEAAADDVDSLEQSLADLESALEGLEGGITADNVSALAFAVEAVGTSAAAVYSTLSDCP
ncbi:MAG: hypothetical protein ACR2OH_00500 [Microthrixaceae bacterium]